MMDYSMGDLNRSIDDLSKRWSDVLVYFYSMESCPLFGWNRRIGYNFSISYWWL